MKWNIYCGNPFTTQHLTRKAFNGHAWRCSVVNACQLVYVSAHNFKGYILRETVFVHDEHSQNSIWLSASLHEAWAQLPQALAVHAARCTRFIFGGKRVLLLHSHFVLRLTVFKALCSATENESMEFSDRNGTGSLFIYLFWVLLFLHSKPLNGILFFKTVGNSFVSCAYITFLESPPSPSLFGESLIRPLLCDKWDLLLWPLNILLERALHHFWWKTGHFKSLKMRN